MKTNREGAIAPIAPLDPPLITRPYNPNLDPNTTYRCKLHAANSGATHSY